MSNLSTIASQVPVAMLDQEVAQYMKNEISYTEAFKSNYVLVEFKDTESGKVWYVVDGYFTLKDKTVLFVDFNYYPKDQTYQVINNYAFVPEENKRFLLQAEEICNPFKRNFIGVVLLGFEKNGHLDELMSALEVKFGVSPMLYTDGRNHMIQDFTLAMGMQPLFTLNEQTILGFLKELSYVKQAMLIPSGRNPSSDKITQTYHSLSSDCKL